MREMQDVRASGLAQETYARTDGSEIERFYKMPGAAGWSRARRCAVATCCELLERGQILFFRELPFDLPVEDREFLLSQQWAELRLHKNVSYRPGEDICAVFRATPRPSSGCTRSCAITRRR